jgi:DNA-binding PadR family transcriptional regulator
MPDAARFLPVKSTVFLILLAIAEQPMHGYAITQEVRRRSRGTVDLGTSHLYRHLKRLLDDQLVEETDGAGDDDDPRRRYYKLTRLGREVVRAESARLKVLLEESKRLGFVR